MSNWLQLFQYQAKAEPVLVPAAPATITVDMWYVAPESPMRRRPMTLLPEYFAPTFALAEQSVTLDEWEPRLSQPLPRRKQAIGNDGATTIDPTLFIVPTVSDWAQPISQPVMRKRWPLPTFGGLGVDETTFVVPPPVLIEWMQPISQPRPRIANRLAGYPFGGVEPVLPVPSGIRICDARLATAREMKSSIASGRLGTANIN